MPYYKAFDVNLRGHKGFQFEVGKVFTTDNEDTWQRFHMCRSIKNTLDYYHTPRICIVEPIDGITDFGEGLVSCSKIRIVRELSREEIINKLKKERVTKKFIRFIYPDYVA